MVRWLLVDSIDELKLIKQSGTENIRKDEEFFKIISGFPVVGGLLWDTGSTCRKLIGYSVLKNRGLAISILSR